MTRLLLPTVSHVVAIAGGKGGVGKTTVTLQLALALQRAGHRVGIFDADVYGPNVRAMLGGSIAGYPAWRLCPLCAVPGPRPTSRP